ELAALPTDHRLADIAALALGFSRDCRAFAPLKESPCELRLDLDGDGALDRAFKIRERGGARAGMAIVWGHGGGVSVIGAGAPSLALTTDVYEDGFDLSWSETEEDFSSLQRWAVAEVAANGFQGSKPRGHSAGEHVAPSVVGAGIWLDGSDA